MDSLNVHEKAALDRLIAHAKRDSGQSAKAANFLLSWWNADKCGAFDPRDMWDCDQEIVDDMVTLFRYVGNMSDEYEVKMSPLSQRMQVGGKEIDVQIYKDGAGGRLPRCQADPRRCARSH